MKNHYPDDDFEYYHAYHGRPSHEESMDMIRPLVDHIDRVDALRLDLFRNTISINKLHEYRELLVKPVPIGPSYRDRTITLADQDIERKLSHEGLWDIKLNIRKGKLGFPKYHLCEYREFWGQNYGIVLNEYFVSADYKFTDARFARMISYGHETNFIRMSSFRDGVNRYITVNMPDRTNAVLKKVGSYFLQGAWHEDQLTAWIVSEALGLEKFSEAIEIIYFILGSDFTETRDYFDEDVEQFFTRVYPRGSLLEVIKIIGVSKAEDMLNLERVAREWHRSLNGAFSGLLRAEVSWGELKKIPLYRIIYSNIYRLDMVFPLINLEDKMIRDSIEQIEEISSQFINSVRG
jgi:hypothetical protein